MNNKQMIGLGIGIGATIMTLSNIDKVDAATLTAIASLNVRSGPSTSYSKIGYIKAGSPIQYISASNGWYKIRYNGVTGWVISTYVSFGNTHNNNTNTNKTVKTVTIKENLNMRSGPSTSYGKVGYIKKNTVVTSTEQSNGWYKIKHNGVSGWVIGNYVTVGNTSSTGTDYNKNTTLKYTTATLNIRSNPSTSSSRIGSIAQGRQVQCLGSSNGWYKVNYNGIVGWVSGQYLSSNKTSVNTKKSIATKVVINRTNRTLKAYDKSGILLLSTRCAVGKPSTPTPTGTFKIVNKIVNRPYYKHNIPGGDPRNPLGSLWMGLSIAGGQTYGIHGNNNASSIGLPVSGGCIRVDNTILKQLYAMCIVGTTVIISD